MSIVSKFIGDISDKVKSTVTGFFSRRESPSNALQARVGENLTPAQARVAEQVVQRQITSEKQEQRKQDKGLVRSILTPLSQEEVQKQQAGALTPAGSALIGALGLSTIIPPLKSSKGGVVGAKLKKPAEQALSEILEFTKSQTQLLDEAAQARTSTIKEYLKNIMPQVNPDEVVKIRKRGNGTVKITRGELEVMKTMGDLSSGETRLFIQNPIRVFEQLGPAVKETFYRPIKVAEDAAAKAKVFWNKQTDDVFKGLEGFRQKSSRRIMEYALSQEEDGRKILEMMKVKPPTLTPEELGAYKYMRSRYDTLLNELNEARAIIGKEPIPKRDNYITHIRDLGILKNMGFDIANSDVEKLLGQFVHRNAPAFQYAKRRTGGFAELEMDAFNVFRKYQESALDNIHLSPAVTKLRELTRTKIPDGDVQFQLQERAPRAFKFIQEWLDYSVGQKVPTRTPQVVQNIAAKLNQNLAFSSLSFNLRSAVIQPSAIVNAVTEVGVKNLTEGVKKLLTGGSEFALQNSKVLQGRLFETAVEDVAGQFFGQTKRAMSKVAQAGLKPLQILDSYTAQTVWLGAYEQALQNGLQGRKAFNFADDIVIKTQASAAKSDVAPIQRTVGGRLITQFQTFVINDFNRLLTDVAGIGNKDLGNVEALKKASKYITAVTMYNILTEDVLGIPSPLPRPIKALKEEGAMASSQELLGQVPIIGGAVRYGTGPFGAVGDIITEVPQKISGKYTPNAWWEIVGKLIGVPGVAQIDRFIKGVEGMKDGFTITYIARDREGNIIQNKEGKPKLKRATIKLSEPVDKVKAFLFGIYETEPAKQLRETGRIPK